MKTPSEKHIGWYTPERIAAGLCITLMGIAAAIFLSQSGQGRFALSISGGSSVGLRHQYTQRLAAESIRHGVSLSLVPTSGSREALDLVDARKLDIAFVQGGFDPSLHPHVRQLAAL